MMRKIFFAICLLVCASCEKRVVSFDTKKSVVAVNAALRGGDGYRAVKLLKDKIDSISDEKIKIACYCQWVDELMVLDISDIGYRQQSTAIRIVQDLTRFDIPRSLRSAGLPLADVWDVKIRGLSWQRKQLERLKPVGPLPKGLELAKGGGLLVLDIDVKRKYLDWLGCYKSAASNYESCISHLEGRTFYIDTLRSTEEEKEILREKLRKYIGRPIRSEEELRRDAKNQKAMEFPYDGWFKGKGPLKF